MTTNPSAIADLMTQISQQQAAAEQFELEQKLKEETEAKEKEIIKEQIALKEENAKAEQAAKQSEGLVITGFFFVCTVRSVELF